MNCWVCNSPSGARVFGVCVDGEPLRLQRVLCGAHGDAYLLRVGRVIGELLRDHSDPSQSGHTISEEGRWRPEDPRPLVGVKPAELPLPDKSGRSDGGYSCDAYAVKLVGQDRFYCDRGAGHQGAHHNANVGEWTDPRIDSGKAP